MARLVVRGSQTVFDNEKLLQTLVRGGCGGGLHRPGLPFWPGPLAGSALGAVVSKSTHARELSPAVVDHVTSRAGHSLIEGPHVDPLDLTFSDTRTAFQSKTTWEVLRGYLVFTLCSSKYLVQNNAALMKLAKRLLGQTLFGWTMQMTFYGQFVAGADQVSIKPLVNRMSSFGVKSILDYSVEEDLSAEQAKNAEMMSCTPNDSSFSEDEVSVPMADPCSRYEAHEEFADRRLQVMSARTYFYMNEAQCERNMETFLRSIEAVSHSTQGTGLAAIKMTALGRPQLLLQLSKVIMRTRSYLAELAGKETATDVISQDVSKATVVDSLRSKAGVDPNSPEVAEWLNGLTYDQKGLIHLFSWSGLIDARTMMGEMFQVPSLSTGQMEPLMTALSHEEEEMFKNMMRRLHHIFAHAKDCDVRVMVDAEQTYFQPAISRLTMEMMRKYNKEKAIVFNTYQCYLKDAYHSLIVDLDQAERQKFFFGAKLVRGAYMEQERARASSLGYEDPVNPTFDATTTMYERCLTESLRRIEEYRQFGQPKKLAIMVASHNEDTVRFTVNSMKEYNIQPSDKVVCFAQLLGMCDNISFPLGQAGYSVYKYVPYGPVDDVLPYLSRRAHENQGIMHKVVKERRMLGAELVRRLTAGQLWHTPRGQYSPA